MKVRLLLLLAAGCLLLAAAGAMAMVSRSTPPDSIPSEAEAMAAVSLAFAHANSPEQLCSEAASQGNCHALLEGAPSPPTQAPRLVCTSQYRGEGSSAPGRLVRVSGVDGDGTAYVTDILAIHQDGSTVLMNPVFWRSASVSDSQVSGQTLDPCS